MDSSTQPRPQHKNGSQQPDFAVLTSQEAGARECLPHTSLTNIIVIRPSVKKGTKLIMMIIKVEGEPAALQPKKLITRHTVFCQRFVEFI